MGYKVFSSLYFLLKNSCLKGLKSGATHFGLYQTLINTQPQILYLLSRAAHGCGVMLHRGRDSIWGIFYLHNTIFYLHNLHFTSSYYSEYAIWLSDTNKSFSSVLNQHLKNKNDFSKCRCSEERGVRESISVPSSRLKFLTC